MKTLTKKQKSILEFVHQFTEEHRYPPSIREIGNHFDMKSNNAVNDHLDALKKKECIRRSGAKHTSRSIVITATGYRILGIVDASEAQKTLLRVPIIEKAEQLGSELPPSGYISVDSSLFGPTTSTTGTPNTLFGYVKRGDKMAKAGIRNGDILIVRAQDKANSDSITLIRRNGDILVRRYSLDGERIRLQLADDAVEPEYVDAKLPDSDFAILGVVVGLIRNKI